MRPKQKSLVAFCWRTGRIEFAGCLPENAVQLTVGPARRVRAEVTVAARHAYDGKTLLVPGVPEALNEHLALKAVRRFVIWLKHGSSAFAPLKWTWLCEFCYRASKRSQLPKGWAFDGYSAVCADCQPKIEAYGGITVVRGGEFAKGRRDPRDGEGLA